MTRSRPTPASKEVVGGELTETRHPCTTLSDDATVPASASDFPSSERSTRWDRKQAATMRAAIATQMIRYRMVVAPPQPSMTDLSRGARPRGLILPTRSLLG